MCRNDVAGTYTNVMLVNFVGSLRYDCPKMVRGCTIVRRPRAEIEEHAKVCAYQMVKCPYVPCTHMGPLHSIESRKELCRFQPMQCPLCSEVIPFHVYHINRAHCVVYLRQRIKDGNASQHAAAHAQHLLNSPKLFANKFILHEDRVAVNCLEEHLANRTLDYYTGARTFNTDVYAKSDHVTHRLMKGLQDYENT